MIPRIYYKLKYIFEMFYHKVYFTFIVWNPHRISFKPFCKSFSKGKLEVLKLHLSRVYTDLYINGLDINSYINLYI